ncbi:MAG TPA: hypothetical protein VF195_02225 [Actinomycetota bacterium]
MSPRDMALLTVPEPGFCGTFLVAARIAHVVGHTKPQQTERSRET